METRLRLDNIHAIQITVRPPENLAGQVVMTIDQRRLRMKPARPLP